MNFSEIKQGQWFRSRGILWQRINDLPGFNAVRHDTGDLARMRPDEVCDQTEVEVVEK